MSAAPVPPSAAVDLDVATDEAIAACRGDARAWPMILETVNEVLRASVSAGYSRGRFELRDCKDARDV
jgi:hypothetical protein